MSLADHRDCPGSPGMSIPPSQFGAADRTFIRANPRPSVACLSCLLLLATRLPMGRLAKPRFSPQLAAASQACLQNRLNELGQNLAIEIREW